LRHGRTELNATGRLSGRGDHSIDERGVLQAQAAAAAMAALFAEHGDESVRIVTSPLKRCRETAGVVAAALGAIASPVEVDPRFIEMDYGEWEGRPLAEIPAQAWLDWQSDPQFCPPGGESLAAVTERVSIGLADLAGHTSGPVVVVSHVSPIKAAVVSALGVDESITWRMRLSNASTTRISVGPHRSTLLSFNETGYLGDLHDP
jgi:probable phosphoglycerate mutase